MVHVYYGEDLEVVQAIVEGLALRAKGAKIKMTVLKNSNEMSSNTLIEYIKNFDAQTELVVFGQCFDYEIIEVADLVSCIKTL
ncbi:MAG: hypothetical protein FWE44_00545 [Defluviitaleaceae bacterium]|nr:hypothetical protein [Defluviitaleaceae bacterium]